MGNVRPMDKNEKIIYDIIYQTGNWKFFQVLDSMGNSMEQVKIYDPPSRIAYPDFEKIQDEKIILLVEVKGYYGFFDNREDTVAMAYRQFRQYFVVQNKEHAEVRIAFVIKNPCGNSFYWETLNNIDAMEYYFDMYKPPYKRYPEKYIFWNIDEFRTDIENLGL